MVVRCAGMRHIYLRCVDLVCLSSLLCRPSLHSTTLHKPAAAASVQQVIPIYMQIRSGIPPDLPTFGLRHNMLYDFEK